MKQKGFTLLNFMAFVVIIGIIAAISVPVLNHNIEKSKASAGLAALGTFKNDVAVCFMHKDDFDNCDSGLEGVHKLNNPVNRNNRYRRDGRDPSRFGNPSRFGDHGQIYHPIAMITKRPLGTKKSNGSKINLINSVYISDGVIVANLMASNHFEDQEHITIELTPNASPDKAGMNWDIYCSDYNASAETHLIDTCIGELQGSDSTGP